MPTKKTPTRKEKSLGIFGQQFNYSADPSNYHEKLVAGMGGLPVNNNNANMGWGGAGMNEGVSYEPPHHTGYAGHGPDMFSMARGRGNTSLSEAAARGAGGAAGPVGPMNTFFGMNQAASSVAGLVGAPPATVAMAMENNSREGNAALVAAAAAAKPKAPARKPKVSAPGGGGAAAAPVVLGAVSAPTVQIFSTIEQAAQTGTRALGGLYANFIGYIQTVSQADRAYLKQKLTEIARGKPKDINSLLMAMANYIRV
jgi:hypothetical protein